MNRYLGKQNYRVDSGDLAGRHVRFDYAYEEIEYEQDDVGHLPVPGDGTVAGEKLRLAMHHIIQSKCKFEKRDFLCQH